MAKRANRSKTSMFQNTNGHSFNDRPNDVHSFGTLLESARLVNEHISWCEIERPLCPGLVMQNKNDTQSVDAINLKSDYPTDQSNDQLADEHVFDDRISISTQLAFEQQIADKMIGPQAPSNDTEIKNNVSSSTNIDQKRDLEFSTSLGHLNDNNYVHIENDTTFQLNDEEVSVSVVLNYCKNGVFKPYFRLVSIVGLRPLFGPNTLFNLSQLPLIGCLLSSINIIYTFFILSIILLGYLLQATSCYRQDGLPTFVQTKPIHQEGNNLTINRFKPTTTTQSPNLSIDINSLNKTIQKLDDLNSEILDRESDDLMLENKSAKFPVKYLTEEEYFKKNLNAYKDVYEIGLRNGHIWLNKPVWHKKAMLEKLNKSAKSGDGQSFDAQDYIDPEKNAASLVCSGNLFTMFLLPDLLHLMAYLFTIYLMRASEIEKTEHLLEKSFLQASQTNGWLIAHRKLVQKLRFFLYLAFAWLIVSVINHLLHILFQTIRFTILDQLTLFYHVPQLQAKLQTPLLVFTVVTLIVKDLVCSVIIASYAIHCELNISFIQNLCRSLREKKVELQEFVKGIEEARKFVHYLNHEQSLAVSLLTVSISSQLLQAFYKLFHQIFNNESCLLTGLLVSVSALLWLSKLLTPLIQASRLSSTCNELRYIGLELRARPFGYQDTLQSDLDSIVIYTSNLRLKGRIIYCPIKKSFLFCALAFTIVIILFLGTVDRLRLLIMITSQDVSC